MVMPAVLTNHRVAMADRFWRCKFCRRAGTTAEVATWGETCEPRFWGEPPITVSRKPVIADSANDWPCPRCGAPPGRNCISQAAAGLRENRQPHRARRNGGGR